jgi:fengycin family lipopeptide synthetase D
VPIKNFEKSNLTNFLADKLPYYMVPALILETKTIPLNTNGKIDRKLLPEPDLEKIFSANYEGPTSDIEIKLVIIWQDVLDIDRIGVRDNFYELGGHSLNANALVNKISREFSVDVNIADIFKNATIKDLAKLIISYQKEKYDYKDLC